MSRPAEPAPVTLALTAGALVAFAANSVLCRVALGANRVDPASFTTIRLVSGAVTLLGVLWLTRGGEARVPRGNWLSAAMLFVYAAPFSFAYVGLQVGTGALLLFGTVQATMLAAGWQGGERPDPGVWIGLLLALAGLVVLVLPGLAAPPLWAALLMVIAGVAWGFYSLRGRGASDPLADTAGHFVRASLFSVVLSVVSIRALSVQGPGVWLAVASGALASGLGYVVWYAALRGLSATRAAMAQLAVPLLAAVAGTALLTERVTVRLVAASLLILGGVALAWTSRVRGV